MIKAIISGCIGKMGQELSDEIESLEDIKVIAGVDRSTDEYKNAYPVFQNINEITEKADVILDFSNRSNLKQLLEYSTSNKIGLVIATTGLTDEDMVNIKKASEEIPVFHSANTSIGINVLKNIVKKTVSILGDSFDIEIIEKHHNKKLDAPSGTAYMLADAINEELFNEKAYKYGRIGNNEKRRKNEIGIHAVRGGTIAGEHTILFAGQDEILEIKHTALSKNIFANGAINAARFIVEQRPGLYQMDDVLKI